MVHSEVEIEPVAGETTMTKAEQRRRMTISEADVLVVNVGVNEDPTKIDAVIVSAIDFSMVRNVVLSSIRSASEVKHARKLAVGEKLAKKARSANRNSNSNSRRLQDEDAADADADAGSVQGIYYVNMTPNIFAGLLFFFMFAFTAHLGLSCLNMIKTSTAVEHLTCFDSSISGYFRLSFGGKVAEDIPHDFSAAAMQVILASLHSSGSKQSSVQVNQSIIDGNFQWEITFIDHLKLWSQVPLSVLPGSDGFTSVSDNLSVKKRPLAGIYPVRYTLWEKGTYELSVFSASTLTSGSSYTIEVANGAPQALSSSAFGKGLEI